MDITSILGLIASGVTIATRTVKDINDLWEKYHTVEQELKLLCGRVQAVRAALRQIHETLAQNCNGEIITSDLQEELVSAIDPCVVVLSGIERHISSVNAGWNGGKLRHLWGGSALRDHVRHLDSQVGALSLLLAAIQLSNSIQRQSLLKSTKSRGIIRKARYDASSYTSSAERPMSRITSTSNTSAQFHFDDEIINSDVYRAAFRVWTKGKKDTDAGYDNAKSPAVLDSISEVEHPSGTDPPGDSATDDASLTKTALSYSKRAPWKRRAMLRVDSLLHAHRKPQWSNRKKIVIGVLVIVTICVVVPLAVLSTRQALARSSKAFPSGFPVIETGMFTVSRPDLVQQISECVEPSTLWSCAISKEEQNQNPSQEPTQPNLKFSISIGDDSDQDAIPDPPTINDLSFMGSTTDNVTQPFEGEISPLSISLSTTTYLRKRSTRISMLTRAHIARRTISSAVSSNDHVSPVSLLPSFQDQPVRLYDRGLPTEHYGFYVYYDKTIFSSDFSANDSINVVNFEDQDGGAPIDNATARCTWAQTRFRVQIWTSSLLNNTVLPASGSTEDPTFSRPITITIDRHGGSASSKAVFCNSIDIKTNSTSDQKFLVPELRAVGGFAISADSDVLKANRTGSYTGVGIDGGTGGCMCQWQNWVSP